MRAARGLAAIALASLVVFGGYLGWNSSLLELQRVEVAGNERVSKEEIVRAAGLDRGTHLFSVSPGAVVESLSRIGWVRSATVERVIPSTLRITVRERSPAAEIVLRDRHLLVDALGIVLTEGRARLPLITDLPVPGRPKYGSSVDSPEFDHALRIHRGLPLVIRQRVASVSAPKVDRITITLTDGLVILYGAGEQMEQKNYSIAELMREGVRSGRPVGYIDVRVPSRPATR